MSGNRLVRRSDNKVLAGVCSGIAAYFNWNVDVVRVVTVVLSFIAFWATISGYFVAWMLLPDNITGIRGIDKLNNRPHGYPQGPKDQFRSE